MHYYPNYLPNNYSPYQIPGYGMPQAGQTYPERMAQFQPMQQNFQTQPAQTAYQPLAGRIVEDFSVITANDVPMDGSGAIFVKHDGSEIQLRNWTAQGTISTSRFKPVLESQTENLSGTAEKMSDEHFSAFQDVFMQKFDEIGQRLDRMEKAFGKKTKREVTDDE